MLKCLLLFISSLTASGVRYLIGVEPGRRKTRIEIFNALQILMRISYLKKGEN